MGEVSEPIKKCAALLQNAQTDTEKFAALFLVTKLVRAKDCKLNAKKLLFEAIGFKFLKRLLLTTDVPVDCPPSIYKSVALSVLTTFCNEPDLATHPEMLSNVPVFLDILKISNADDDDEDDDNLIVVGEAYKCLKCIAQHDNGQRALNDAGTFNKMIEIFSKESFQTDEALNILAILANRFGTNVWTTIDEPIKQFHQLLNKIALDFETDHDERKFDLCLALNALLFNAPQSLDKKEIASFSNETWPQSVYKGLNDILKSKIGKQQRNPAIVLCATFLNLLTVDYMFNNAETRDDNIEETKKFFLLLLQLAAIEVRMQLDGKSLTQATKEADLITSCYLILELSLNYIAQDQLDLDQREKQTLYTGLKGAFTAVVGLLTKINADKNRDNLPTNDKRFVYATVRVLASWLAQETSAMRPQIYALLPFILKLSYETFRNHSNESTSKESATSGNSVDTTDHEVDLLRILLPALCHLTVEDDARKIILKENLDSVLYDCLRFHWSIVHYKRPPVPRSERLKYLNQPQEIPPAILAKQSDSRTAIISICNIFMNLTVLECKIVEDSNTFNDLMKFIFDNLPELKNIPENLVVSGNMAVSGLLLLKQQSKRIKKNDFSICRYIQTTIRFLWDAYVIDESNDPNALVVAISYKEHWMELMELWFLGMQTMSAVLALVPWISEFAIDSGWAEGIIVLLKKVKVGTLQPNVKLALEDFLCHLVDANSTVVEVLTKADALKACRNHRLMDLGKKLFGD